MPNQKLAKEWLKFSERNLETAILLNKENHYTDVIAIDIQQAVEKALKSLYAFDGHKIPRTHSLDILFNYASKKIQFPNTEIKDIAIINDYYESERYPGPKYFAPSRSEIVQMIDVAKNIIAEINQYISSGS